MGDDSVHDNRCREYCRFPKPEALEYEMTNWKREIYLLGYLSASVDCETGARKIYHISSCYTYLPILTVAIDSSSFASLPV